MVWGGITTIYCARMGHWAVSIKILIDTVHNNAFDKMIEIGECGKDTAFF